MFGASTVVSSSIDCSAVPSRSSHCVPGMPIPVSQRLAMTGCEYCWRKCSRGGGEMQGWKSMEESAADDAGSRGSSLPWQPEASHPAGLE